MTAALARASAGLLLAVLLAGCLLTPGKFQSDLVLHKDGRFAFTYVGEVTVVDPMGSLENIPVAGNAPPSPEQQAETERKAAERDAKFKAMVDAISREKGVRSIRHLGDGTFALDYAIEGRLDHAFLFPFNSDAQVAVPFLMIEPRQDGVVRVKAIGFVGNGGDAVPLGAAVPSPRNPKVDGVFTVRTDAEVLSHNDEDGPAAGGLYEWRIDPLRKDPPTLTARIES